jgi:hypothetical protein
VDAESLGNRGSALGSRDEQETSRLSKSIISSYRERLSSANVVRDFASTPNDEEFGDGSQGLYFHQLDDVHFKPFETETLLIGCSRPRIVGPAPQLSLWTELSSDMTSLHGWMRKSD